jgi:hypothetical protein
MHWRSLHRQHQPTHVRCPTANDKQSHNNNNQEAGADHVKQEARANAYNHFKEARTTQVKYEATNYYDQEARANSDKGQSL